MRILEDLSGNIFPRVGATCKCNCLATPVYTCVCVCVCENLQLQCMHMLNIRSGLRDLVLGAGCRSCRRWAWVGFRSWGSHGLCVCVCV